MKPVWLIFRREMGAYLRSPLGYVVAAIVFIIAGLFFNTMAMGGDTAKKSSVVLHDFFFYTGGLNATASLFLAMRLLAEERQNGTMTLLFGAPIRDYQIVLGKYLAALTFQIGMLALTLYMPMLVLIHGKITVGHLVAGYLGMLLFCSASLGIGIFASAMTRSQLIAVVVGAFILVFFVVCWKLAEVADRPLNELFSWMSLHNKHQQPFMSGLINTQDVVFYLSATYFFLFLATRVLESRRWSS